MEAPPGQRYIDEEPGSERDELKEKDAGDGREVEEPEGRELRENDDWRTDPGVLDPGAGRIEAADGVDEKTEESERSDETELERKPGILGAE